MRGRCLQIGVFIQQTVRTKRTRNQQRRQTSRQKRAQEGSGQQVKALQNHWTVCFLFFHKYGTGWCLNCCSIKSICVYNTVGKSKVFLGSSSIRKVLNVNARDRLPVKGFLKSFKSSYALWPLLPKTSFRFNFISQAAFANMSLVLIIKRHLVGWSAANGNPSSVVLFDWLGSFYWCVYWLSPRKVIIGISDTVVIPPSP